MVRLTFIPNILWPGTGQNTSYLPFLKVTLSLALLPGAMFGVVAFFRPGPVMVRAWVVEPLFSATKT